MAQQTWFITFWGFLLLLGLLEYLFSDTGTEVERRSRWPVNIGLAIANGLIFSLVPVSIILAAIWAITNDIGLFNLFDTPAWLLVPVTIFVRSLAQYAFHRVLHKIPALWAIHRIHHCDCHFDGTTALRFHPLELIANLVFIAPVVILLGLDPATLAVFETIEIFVGILTHTSLKLPAPVEKSLRIIFITPGLHRLHHSDYEPETESNFGSFFSFWDRMFGTYLGAPKRPLEEFAVGLEDVEPKRAADFGWLIISPFLPARSKRQK